MDVWKVSLSKGPSTHPAAYSLPLLCKPGRETWMRNHRQTRFDLGKIILVYCQFNRFRYCEKRTQTLNQHISSLISEAQPHSFTPQTSSHPPTWHRTGIDGWEGAIFSTWQFFSDDPTHVSPAPGFVHSGRKSAPPWSPP